MTTSPLPALTVLAVRNAERVLRLNVPAAEAMDEARRQLAIVYAPGVLRAESGVYLLDGHAMVAIFDENGDLRDTHREIGRPLALDDLATLLADERYPAPGRAQAVLGEPAGTRREAGLFPNELYGAYALSIQGSRGHHCEPKADLERLQDYDAVELVVYGPDGMLEPAALRALGVPESVVAKFDPTGVGPRLTWVEVNAIRACLHPFRRAA